MSVPFAPQPGISGIFGRMESALSEQLLVGEEHCVTTRVTAAKETSELVSVKSQHFEDVISCHAPIREHNQSSQSSSLHLICIKIKRLNY